MFVIIVTIGSKFFKSFNFSVDFCLPFMSSCILLMLIYVSMKSY